MDRCGLGAEVYEAIRVREKRGLAKRATPSWIPLGIWETEARSTSTELCIWLVESKNLSGLVVDLDELDLAGERTVSVRGSNGDLGMGSPEVKTYKTRRELAGIRPGKPLLEESLLVW